MVPAVDALLSMGNAGGQPPALHPHDTDWIIPAGAVLVAVFALSCIMVFIILRCSSCKERNQGVSMFEHECIVASLGMVLLLVISLASLYYFFCYRGGCYGAVLAGGAPAIAGRKAKMTMSRTLADSTLTEKIRQHLPLSWSTGENTVHVHQDGDNTKRKGVCQMTT
ncbi:hypothetical protein Taro_046436 [Colocasia esculenta]|uniref:Uncharacterized protein n=1 Tax=Colocasia esculenta TaxID=4460 RepID=A0A843X7E2_COLES|nr:hypothetical protein [Colocasia esculenta]